MTPSRKRRQILLKGAIIIAFFSLLSKISGLLRVMLLSSRYATGDIADAYLTSFRLPDLIFNTLVLGVLSSAFIPIFLEYFDKEKDPNADVETDALEVGLESSETSMASPNVGFAAGVSELWSGAQRKWHQYAHEEHTEKWALANTVLNLVVLALIVFSVLFFVFAPELVKIMVPSFSANKQALTIEMTRIMLVSTVLFGISNVMGGMLQSFQRFFWFSLAPVLYNAGIIIGILWFTPIFGPLGLAYGVVFGAFLHMIIQIPPVLKVGFCWRPVFKIKHNGVKKILLLMAPRTGGLAAIQVNQVINTFLASSLSAGSVSALYYADSLQSLPVSIFGVSLAIAAFPILGASFNNKDDNAFTEIFSENFRKILFILIPISLFMILLRAQIVRLVLGTGSFGWGATRATLDAFGFLALSLFAQGTVPLLARAFYARHDTLTPLISSAVSVVLNIVLAFALVSRMGLVGIALAFSIASLCNMTILWTILRCRLPKLHTTESLLSVIKISLASLASGFAVYGMLRVAEHIFNNKRYFGLLGQTAVSAFVGIVLYCIVVSVWKFPEAQWIAKHLQRRK
ncbi:MAG: Integral membrane protein MviN [Parcubacteria group bacterium GW2011_GWA2_44_12]|nr:MAG: Integral membrane protein MviN [Parcubacteria group bacterium GW2011_GWA2_44_12]